MQAETQIQPIAALENAPFSESVESKSKRGGKRPGAGRKPNLAKRLLKGLSREAIHEAMATMDIGGVIIGLMKSKRERTRLETLVFVWDRMYGRPAQNVQLTGSMLHAHTIWRPLETLTDDEVALLDKLTRKLSQPVLDASPNASQNQTESNTAGEVVDVESEAIEN